VAYDVQVKTSLSHYLLIALFVLAPDLRRVTDFFIFRRQTQLRTEVPLFRAAWKNRTVWALQLLFALYATTATMVWAHDRVKEKAELPKTTPFYGILQVDEFLRDGTARAALTTYNIRWQRIVIESCSRVVLQMKNGTLQ